MAASAEDPPPAARRRLFDRPYLLLVVATLSWGGNAVAGRLAVGEISPMLLTGGRWLLVLGLLALFMRRRIIEGLPLLRRQWRSALWMGALGFTGFNALFYASAHHTTAVNMSILQGAIPVLVLLGALALHRTPIRLGQAVGVAVTLAGVAVVASHGDLSALLALRFNLGDLFMLVACGFYAAYTLALRGRTGVSGFAFFAGLAAAAFATTVPLAAAEALAGAAVWPSLRGLAILAFVALGPSFVAQIFYMRSVELIGPGRAGLFINLVPVFGALMAVALLGEPFGWHSALALLLVLCGIGLAETSVRTAPRP